MGDAIQATTQYLEVLKTIAPDLIDKLEVVPLVDTGFKYLLHISSNGNIPKFTPIVPPRGTPESDHRVPRICTAFTLVGCIIGYAAVNYDFFKRTQEDGFLGGYKIYTFTPDIAVKPSQELLSDVHITGEHWIVSHSAETAHYSPVIRGEIIVNSVKTTTEVTEADRELTVEFEFFIHVTDSIPWSHQRTLQPGYYRITAKDVCSWGFQKDGQSDQNYDDSNSTSVDRKCSVYEIDEIAYRKTKSLIAAMLDYDNSPKSMWW
jgi:hypothetical protein